MNKIFMITEHNIDGIDASGNRAQWEINALKKNEFPDVTLIDKFELIWFLLFNFFVNLLNKIIILWQHLKKRK